MPENSSPGGRLMAFAPDTLRRARVALTVAFAGNGFMSGALVARIADVRNAAHLSNAGLGTALLVCSIANFAAMAPTSRMVSRMGSGPATLVGIATYAVTFPLVGLFTSVALLWLALALYGVAVTIFEVAMNSHAVALEHVYERRIMTVQHAMWSGGQLAGVAIGGVLAQAHFSIFWHFSLAALLVAVVSWVVRGWFLPATVDQRDRQTMARKGRLRFSWRQIPFFFLALGVLGLCEQIGEGATGTWGVVLARDAYHASPLVATLPYVACTMWMVVGRLYGDRLATAFSTRTILASSGLLIAVGLGVGMTLNSLVGEFFAWTLLGIGCSNVIPLLFSAAGRAARTRPAAGIQPAGALALVTAIAYSGSLIGPPVIGSLADYWSLHWALLLPGALGVVMTIGVLVVLRAGENDHLEPSVGVEG